MLRGILTIRAPCLSSCLNIALIRPATASRNFQTIASKVMNLSGSQLQSLASCRLSSHMKPRSFTTQKTMVGQGRHFPTLTSPFCGLANALVKNPPSTIMQKAMLSTSRSLCATHNEKAAEERLNIFEDKLSWHWQRKLQGIKKKYPLFYEYVIIPLAVIFGVPLSMMVVASILIIWSFMAGMYCECVRYYAKLIEKSE